MLNRALWEQLRPLGSLPRKHVHHRRSTATDLRHQAHELPRRHPGLRAQDVDATATCPCACGELGLVHRHELSGALHGLMRVRCFTQDDAHIFMTPEQIQRRDHRACINMIDEVYKVVWLRLPRRAVHAAGELHRHGRDVGNRHRRPARRAGRPGRALRRSTRATARSTARRSTSTWKTAWAAPGSAAPSSWT